jgi:hypothetical protein
MRSRELLCCDLGCNYRGLILLGGHWKNIVAIQKGRQIE